MNFWNANNFQRAFFISLLMLLSFTLYAQDSDNMEFWFVAPDAAFSHSDRPTFFMISTGDLPADVTISMPANPSFNVSQHIEANSYWKYEFSTEAELNLIENAYTSSGIATNKGILITSSSPVFAYYQIDGDNQKEIFTLKGNKALGEEFYMPFQTVYKISDRTNYNNEQFRQIQIVATQDGTDVVIHPKNGAVFKAERGTIDTTSLESARTVRLNRGQTLLWRENVRNTPNLTGTRITSSKPIAITHFEDCVHDSRHSTPANGSVDPIGDQMVPVDNLGQNYIVIKGYSSGNAKDHVGILAIAEGTTEVWMRSEGQSERRIATLSQGAYHSEDLGVGNTFPGAYYIRTTQPVYCLHQSAAGNELGGAILPSLYSITARNIRFMKGTMPINAMFLVFREDAKDGFTMDGNPLSVTAQSVGFEDWRYAKVNLTNNSGEAEPCEVKNSKGSFSLGYFVGNTSPTALYGYMSAFGKFSFGTDTIYHCGDSYPLDAPYALSYKWTLPDGSMLPDTTTSSFEATQSGPYRLTVYQDPYTITDEVYLKLQNFNHILHAPEQLLQEKSYNFSIVLNPQKDKDNYYPATYEWKFFDSDDSGGTPIVTSTERIVNVSYPSPGLKTIELKVGNPNAKCDTVITRTIMVLDKSEGEVLYWKRDTKDRNWNNVNNWAKDPEGNHPIAVVPADYTKVYLPGKAANYPSLTEENTDWTLYGQPEADEIVFRYGSELHYQHKLKYNKAYIDYNWGYYGNNNPASGEQPDQSLENGNTLSRNTWHILATPLKSMASGDFSLAGYPFSWQTQFTVTTPGSVVEGDLSQAFPTNDVPLANNNNAIAAKMAGYESGKVGHENQTNLEGLKGVIEIPYFGSDSLKAHYTAHSYDALAKKSFFYYFDTRTLKLLNSPIGSMGRAGEAYRFVYETDQNEPPASGTYEMPLNTGDMGTTLEVMVGNPFLAPVDARAFAGANTGEIVFDQGFKLLKEDGTWEQKSFEGDTIPAWKAFIVTLSGSGVSSLSFPLEDNTDVAPTVANLSGKTRASFDTGSAGNALSVHILKAGVESGDRAILQNNRFANNTGIRKMILPEGHQAPEIFFISSGGDLSYLVRNLEQGENEVAIGVKTSDTRSPLTLQFKNVHAFTASTGAKAILVDKHLNVRQDLTQNPAYRFVQQEPGLDKQYVDKNRFVLQLGGESGISEQEDAPKGIEVIYRSGILKVTSDENINTISVYDLYGRPVFSARAVNLSQYTHPVALQGKQLFLVRVKTVSGKEKVKKIIGD